MKFQYEERYEKWLKTNPSDVAKGILRPVRRPVVVCLPNCLNQMTDDEANQVIDEFVFPRIEKLLAVLLDGLTAKYEGGKENG